MRECIDSLTPCINLVTFVCQSPGEFGGLECALRLDEPLKGSATVRLNLVLILPAVMSYGSAILWVVGFGDFFANESIDKHDVCCDMHFVSKA